jgi:hypothetical protein
VVATQSEGVARSPQSVLECCLPQSSPGACFHFSRTGPRLDSESSVACLPGTLGQSTGLSGSGLLFAEEICVEFWLLVDITCAVHVMMLVYDAYQRGEEEKKGRERRGEERRGEERRGEEKTTDDDNGRCRGRDYLISTGRSHW